MYAGAAVHEEAEMSTSIREALAGSSWLVKGGKNLWAKDSHYWQFACWCRLASSEGFIFEFL